MQNFLKRFVLSILVVLLPTAVFAASLPPPTGYTTSQLLYEDQFTGSSLDTTKWNPWLGDDVYGRWGDEGNLPYPYSGSNCNSTCSNVFDAEYDDPYPYGYSTNTTGSHLVGGSGYLGLIANLNNYFSNLGFSWASSAVTSYGKMYLPAAGGYVQWQAKMPDSRYGAWAGLWLLSKNSVEMDIQESGYLSGSANVNDVLATHWWGTGGSQIIQNTGVDLSAAYHIYGIEYRPGQSWKIYLDGKLRATYTTGVPTNAPYQILMNLQMAGPTAAGWHTVASSSNPGPFEFDISDMQIYSLAATPTPDTTPPSVPTNVRATLNTPSEINLAWAASTDSVGVTGYKILRNSVQIGTSTTTAYADNTVLPNTAYTYQIEAYDAAGNVSPASTSLSITTPTFHNGAAVGTTGSENVMSRAGRGSVLCTQPTGINGTILSGPQGVKGVVWWYVGFISGCSGWVPQTGLMMN